MYRLLQVNEKQKNQQQGPSIKKIINALMS